jgi:hypothetical protein
MYFLPSRENQRMTTSSPSECSTQPYVCVDKEGQSPTQLNVLYADAVPWNSPSDDQLAYIILKAIFKVLTSTLHTYLGQVCMGPLRMH